MFDTTKKVDIESGKVTYSRTIGGHTASVVATCDKEAEGKLGSDLLCALGLDGIIKAVKKETKRESFRALSIMSEAHKSQLDALREQLVAERNKSWWLKLKASIWNR